MDDEKREREWERMLAAERARKRELWRTRATFVVRTLPALGVMVLPFLLLRVADTPWWRIVFMCLVTGSILLVRLARLERKRDWSAGREPADGERP
ncbi:hypothetical protein ACFVQ4_03240 [Streptomyces laurentii]|uniref:hypothetical protein n=1 Tax=Streptomyces laurentii TaxID=39478 RepID=UPI00368BFBC3